MVKNLMETEENFIKTIQESEYLSALTIYDSIIKVLYEH